MDDKHILEYACYVANLNSQDLLTNDVFSSINNNLYLFPASEGYNASSSLTPSHTTILISALAVRKYI